MGDRWQRLRETDREMDRNRLRETERLRGRERERCRQGQKTKALKDGKQPVFVRGAVAGRGPGFKDVGSPLDTEEISVDPQPGTHGICWLLFLAPRDQDLPDSQRQRLQGEEGHGARVGTSVTLRQEGQVAAVLKPKENPCTKINVKKKKKSLQRKQTLKAKPGEVCLRQALALPKLPMGHRLCSFSPAQLVWEELAGCAAGAGAGGRGAGHPTRGRCSARARLSV